MKVTALIFCLALVPFVAAQAEEQPGLLDSLRNSLQNAWNSIIGNIEVDRYRKDFSARLDSGINLMERGWNQTKEVFEDLKLDTTDLDLQTAEELMQEMAEKFGDLDQVFTDMQNTIQAKVAALKANMPDPFGLFDNEQEAGEEDATAEPEPEPTPEPAQQESYFWDNWF